MGFAVGGGRIDPKIDDFRRGISIEQLALCCVAARSVPRALIAISLDKLCLYVDAAADLSKVLELLRSFQNSSDEEATVHPLALQAQNLLSHASGQHHPTLPRATLANRRFLTSPLAQNI